jgi:hypothetical protein
LGRISRLPVVFELDGQFGRRWVTPNGKPVQFDAETNMRKNPTTSFFEFTTAGAVEDQPHITEVFCQP